MAELSIGAPVLIEIMKPMIEVVVNRVKGEINVMLNFKNDLNNLQHKLELISTIVLNKTAAATSSDTVQVWLRNVVDIMYDAENMLDVLAYEKVRKVVIMKRRSSQRKRDLLIWPVERVYIRGKIGKWIDRINTKIEEALEEARTIDQLRRVVDPAPTNFTTNEGAAAADDRLQQVRRNVDMSMFVGRDADVDFLVDKLCNCPSLDSSLSVAAIVGFAGIGKTRLAKNVFEDKRVMDTFSHTIWIVVSEDFKIEKLLFDMLGYVNMNDKEFGSSNSSEIAVRKLKKMLGGKRYLLVLDDVWNTHQGLWNSMKSCLESIGGSRESMILVTTRDKAVAQTIQASSMHVLSELSEEDSWCLFKQVAFPNKSLEDNDPTKLEIGKRIVGKCKGSPLAIKTIGGTLQNKHHSYEWENIERSELWDLPQDDKTGILPSLKLSNNHLPSPFLKKCFSFCALLPKDFKMDKQWLMSCWMALGLIQPSDNKEQMEEDIGEGYINVLLNISFLQESNRDEVGDINEYIMHDLATSVSRHESLTLVNGKQVTTISDNVRHLGIFGQIEVTSEFWDKSVIHNLRTLIIRNNLLLIHRGPLEYVTYLRVLHLQDIDLEYVPKSIAGLKCLKYLHLDTIPIKVLPEFITELYNLQFLRLTNCELLRELPQGLINLVNLRHLDINRIIKVPTGVIEHLRCLQILPPLRISDGGFQISELGCVPHVSGRLEIHGLEAVKSKQDAETARISHKLRLRQLSLNWNSDDNWEKHEEVLDGLKPNRNLRFMNIYGYGGEKFPSWIMEMDTVYNLLKIIELSDCRRYQKLPTLGNLPSLERLVIKGMDRLEHIGAEFYCDTTEDASSSSKFGVYFPCLKILQLFGLENLSEWNEPCSTSTTIFPSLEELVMEDCPELTTTPNNFPSLTKLTVRNNTSGLPVLNILDNESSLACLKNLHIEGVVGLKRLSQKLNEYCTSLQTLLIDNCHRLKCLPKFLSKLVSLESLYIRNCSNLEYVPNLTGLASLRHLNICWNKKLKYPPEGLQYCTSLVELWLGNCPKVETLPDLKALTHLTNLDICGMPKMICQPPEWIYRLPCLQALHIGYYHQLDHFPDISPLLNITSLQYLLLYGWINLNQDVDISLPEQLQHFNKLQQLQILAFENLESLPDWIGNLSSLQTLVLYKCSKLKKLAAEDAMKRLTKLTYMEIEECPLLKEAIKINGTEHHKISGITVKTD